MSIAQRVNSIRNSNQVDKYRAVVEKVIQLESNDWSMFLELMKNLHSADIHQTEAETKPKELTIKKEKSSEIIKRKRFTESSAQTQTTPPKNTKSPTKCRSYRSPIRPPKTIKDRLKDCLLKIFTTWSLEDKNTFPIMQYKSINKTQ